MYGKATNQELTSPKHLNRRTGFDKSVDAILVTPSFTPASSEEIIM